MVAKAVTKKRAYDRTSHIMIVDDDQTLLKFFKIHLNKFFSRVVVVKNAKEAVDTLKTKEIDLVLSDIRMPRVDGLQLLTRIRKHDASIPVYLISGALLSDEQMQQISEVADGFLRKPFTIDEIQDFISAGMDRREVLKKLQALVSDNKILTSLIAGEPIPNKISDEAKRAEITEVLEELKAVAEKVAEAS